MANLTRTGHNEGKRNSQQFTEQFCEKISKQEQIWDGEYEKRETKKEDCEKGGSESLKLTAHVEE